MNLPLLLIHFNRALLRNRRTATVISHPLRTNVIRVLKGPVAALPLRHIASLKPFGSTANDIGAGRWGRKRGENNSFYI